MPWSWSETWTLGGWPPYLTALSRRLERIIRTTICCVWTATGARSNSNVGDADLVVEGRLHRRIRRSGGDVDVFGHLVLADGVEAADFEELVDELVEAVEFGLHGGVELFPPFGVEVPHPRVWR